MPATGSAARTSEAVTVRELPSDFFGGIDREPALAENTGLTDTAAQGDLPPSVFAQRWKEA